MDFYKLTKADELLKQLSQKRVDTEDQALAAFISDQLSQLESVGENILDYQLERLTETEITGSRTVFRITKIKDK